MGLCRDARDCRSTQLGGDDEVHDSEEICALRVFTDGAAKLSVGWPRVAASAGWTAAAFGPVTLDASHRVFLGAVAPAALVAEIAAIGLIYCELAAEPMFRRARKWRQGPTSMASEQHASCWIPCAWPRWQRGEGVFQRELGLRNMRGPA